MSESLRAVWTDHTLLVLQGLRYALKPFTLVTIAVSAVCVWLCGPGNLALTWDANFQVVVFGVIFPLTFSIAENFRRRERCANIIAEMSSSAIALMWLHRDLDRGVRAAGDAPRHVGLPEMHPPPRRSQVLEAEAQVTRPLRAPVDNAFTVLHELLASTRVNLITSDDEPAAIHASHARAIRCLSTLSRLNEILGISAGYNKGCEGGVSRAAQYPRYLLVNLEQLRILRSYSGSPHGMRYFCALAAHLSPLLLAPYFRHFCAASDTVCVAGYFSSTMYCLVLCMLYSVSVEIEDLCDGDGLDDLIFNADLELCDAALQEPFQAELPADGADSAPKVHVRYDDCLGTGSSASLVRDGQRVYAHREPSRSLPCKSAALQLEPQGCSSPRLGVDFVSINMRDL